MKFLPTPPGIRPSPRLVADLALGLSGLSLLWMALITPVFAFLSTRGWTLTSGGDFFKMVGDNWEFQAFGFWRTLQSPEMTFVVSVVFLSLGLTAVWRTAKDVKERRWGRALAKGAGTVLIASFLVLSTFQPLQVLAATPTTGPIGSSSDTGYGTPCSASFCVFTNIISGTPYYYSMVGLGYNPGSSCSLSTCAVGGVPFGGPLNAGGATGTSFTTVVNDALANGGLTQLSAGNFTIPTASSDVQVGTSNVKQYVALQGQGFSTIINAAGTQAVDFIRLTNNGAKVSNLMVDCSNEATGAAIAAINSLKPNAVISGTKEVHCGSDVAITEEHGKYGNATGTLIENNIIVHNSDTVAANTGTAIEIQAPNVIVTGNYMDYIGGHCILSDGAKNALVTNNVCINSELENGPGSGVEFVQSITDTKGTFPSTNDTFIGNTIINATGPGFQNAGTGTYTDSGLTLIGNTVKAPSSKYCMFFQYMNTLTIANNHCQSGSGFYVQNVIGGSITGNTLASSSTSGYLFGVSHSSGLSITGNTVTGARNLFSSGGSVANFTVSDNTGGLLAGSCVSLTTGDIYGTFTGNVCDSAAANSNAAILLGGTSATEMTFTSNVIEGFYHDYVGTYGSCGGSDYITLSLNQFISPISTAISGVCGLHDTISNNAGFNPGRCTSNCLIGGTSSVTTHTIGPFNGNSTTVIASQTYTWAYTYGKLCFTAVGSTSLTIDGGSAFTPVAACYPMAPSDTVNFGAFGGSAPTLELVFGP